MNTPVISLIVPVYKVEPYLRKCLDSVVNQTYKNLEIILVDDGSPDNCGKICDEYAARDDRIQVIHQENEGVSSARNAGLERATGEWIGWVDPDDWAETDMFEYLLENALQLNADIAVCGHLCEFPKSSIFRGYSQAQILNTEEALKLLFQNDLLKNYLWDKLWRRELFENVRFPKGRTYEDISVVHQMFLRSKTVVFLPQAKYHYLQRPASIVNNTSLENRINYYIASKNRLDEMKRVWPQFVPLLEAQCVASATSIWTAYYANPAKEQNRYAQLMKEIASFCKIHYRSVLQQMHLGRAGRIVIHLTPYTNPLAFGMAYVVGRLSEIKNSKNLRGGERNETERISL